MTIQEVERSGVHPEGTTLANSEMSGGNDISLIYPWLHISARFNQIYAGGDYSDDANSKMSRGMEDDNDGWLAKFSSQVVANPLVVLVSASNLFFFPAFLTSQCG